MSTESLPTSARTPSQPLIIESAEDTDSLYDALRRGIQPTPILTVSEWADKNRILPETSAEPGRWRTSRIPYIKEVMDCLSSHHPCEEVVVMKGAQLGFTEAGNNWIGYQIDVAPGLMLMVNPGINEVKRNTATRLDPLFESTPVLKDLVGEKRGKDKRNNMTHKQYPNGELVMTGSNSAVGLRSLPARYLFLDEVDGYALDADGEGDPVDLARRRTVTFANRRKIYMISTPTIAGVSRIARAIENTDLRRYFVPCFECGEDNWIKWADIKWPKGRPDQAVYKCPHCGHEHRESQKRWLLSNGHWEATQEGQPGKVGFHISSLYSPFQTWASVAQDFLEVHKDPLRFKVWINTTLGEPWVEDGEAPEWEILYQRRETYAIGTVPMGGVGLTAGVDVQKDRVELEVVAWGKENWSWSVDYRVFTGNTADANDPLWDELAKLVDHPYRHESGVMMNIQCMAIDEGFNTQEVRQFVRSRFVDRRRVIVVKGTDSTAAPMGTGTLVDVDLGGKRIKRGLRVWPVGTPILKSQLFGWLNQHPPGDAELEAGAQYPHGYCHHPQYDEEFFRMLASEKIQTKTVRGYPRQEWVKTRDRNEALDCRIYARAAYHRLGWDRYQNEHWDLALAELMERGEGIETPSEAPRRGKRRGPQVYQSSWMSKG